METQGCCGQSKADQPSWGFQLIIDCFGCDEAACCDLDRGYEFLDKITVHLHMTKQTQPYIFKTCETTFPGKPGYSGWVPIIESGIQIHTSANNKFISIDVYSCRPFEESDVVEFVKKWFEPKHIDTHFFYRGMDYRKKSFAEDVGIDELVEVSVKA
ncbi:MAG TPA: S-adenosylmethionine decarboxylase [Thermoanaerobaculia bacterium]|nr:S-adenosylmethionine decarboxylase [Thermoanaerobaculia bacterium]